MRRALPAALGAILVLFAPASAVAAEDGVIADPGSPSSKEYSLPLDAARGDARGGNSDKRQAGLKRADGSGRNAAAVPLFGAGVGPPGGSGGDSGGGSGGTPGHGGGTGGGDSHGSGGGSGNGAGGFPANVSGVNSSDVHASGPSPAVAAGGIALAVLGVGALGGFLARRRMRDQLG